MAQAYAEDGPAEAREQRSNHGDEFAKVGWVARPISDDNSVRGLGESQQVRMPGRSNNRRLSTQEAVHDSLLRTDVDQQHAVCPSRIGDGVLGRNIEKDLGVK